MALSLVILVLSRKLDNKTTLYGQTRVPNLVRYKAVKSQQNDTEGHRKDTGAEFSCNIMGCENIVVPNATSPPPHPPLHISTLAK